MLRGDSHCARWEPIGTPPPMETMVEEYNTLRSGCLQSRNVNLDIFTEDGWICSEMRACSCCFGQWWCYRCVRRQTASKICLGGLLDCASLSTTHCQTVHSYISINLPTCASRLSFVLLLSCQSLTTLTNRFRGQMHLNETVRTRKSRLPRNLL